METDSEVKRTRSDMVAGLLWGGTGLVSDVEEPDHHRYRTTSRAPVTAYHLGAAPFGQGSSLIVLQETTDPSLQSARIADLEQGSRGGERIRDDLHCVKMGADDKGQSEAAGLQQVVPPDRNEGAPDKGHVRKLVQDREFPHRVHHEAIGIGGILSLAEGHPEPGLRGSSGDPAHPLGMPRGDHEPEPWVAVPEAPRGLENDQILLGMGAPGDEDTGVPGKAKAHP
jgi:hypothetical protein